MKFSRLLHADSLSVFEVHQQKCYTAKKEMRCFPGTGLHTRVREQVLDLLKYSWFSQAGSNLCEQEVIHYTQAYLKVNKYAETGVNVSQTNENWIQRRLITLLSEHYSPVIFILPDPLPLVLRSSMFKVPLSTFGTGRMIESYKPIGHDKHASTAFLHTP